MKKLFWRGATALVLGGFIASCSHDDIDYSPIVDGKLKAYQEVFADAYGRIDPNQNWGFTAADTAVASGRVEAAITVSQAFGETYRVGIYAANPLTDPGALSLAQGTVADGQTLNTAFSRSAGWDNLFVAITNSRGYTQYKAATVKDGKLLTNVGGGRTTRSMQTPAVPHITIPTTASLAEYINGATELDEDNNTQNSPGYYYWESADNNGIVKNSNYIIHYLISGSWTGLVNQLPTVGHQWSGNWNSDHTPEDQLVPRSLYVTGKWTIPAGSYQACGQGEGTFATDGVIIVGSTGEIVINGTLNMNNQARLIVLPGGKISGTGTLSVNNGNAAGNENYNGGEITVATFNNNFGKFYNYGKLNITQYQAGGQESNFYNHGVVHINNAGSHSYYVDPNARIFNACQWYCEKDMRAYIIEMVQGSYFYVGGELMTSAGNDGTSDPSYVSLAAGALMQIGSLHNTNTIWTGPTSGYPVVEIGQVTQLDWTPGSPEDGPLAAGYFQNNICVTISDQSNQVWGNAGGELCQDVFWRVVANGQGRGNGGVVNVAKGAADVKIDASAGFVAGSNGCTPGYNGTATPTPTPTPGSETIPIEQGSTTQDQITVQTTREYYETTQLIEQGRVFCEDLGRITTNDLDFNDVVFDAYVYRVTPSTRTIVYEDGQLVSDNTVDGTPTYKTTIVLLAAGGTLPLTIAGSYEVHDVLGHNSTTTIINTIADADGAYGNEWVTHDPVTLGTDFSYSTIEQIPIVVQYGNGETLKLEAITGWAPHKILTPIGTKWVKERVNIATAYRGFKNYVNYSEACWNTNYDSASLYSHPKDNYQPLSTTASVVKVRTEGPTTSYRNKGTSTTTGGYQGEPVLSRKNTMFND